MENSFKSRFGVVSWWELTVCTLNVDEEGAVWLVGLLFFGSGLEEGIMHLWMYTFPDCKPNRALNQSRLQNIQNEPFMKIVTVRA